MTHRRRDATEILLLGMNLDERLSKLSGRPTSPKEVIEASIQAAEDTLKDCPPHAPQRMALMCLIYNLEMVRDEYV